MGLFDIFKRRNKRKQQEPQSTEADSAAPAQEQPAPDSTNPESAASVKKPADRSAEEKSEASAERSAETKSEAPAEPLTERSDEPKSAVPAKESTEQPAEAKSAAPAKEPTEQSAEPESAALQSEAPQPANQPAPKPAQSSERESQKYEHGLAKSRSSFGQRLNKLFANFRSVDEDFFDDLEDTLIESDVGFEMAVQLTDELRDEVKLRNVKSRDEVQNVVVQKLIEHYDADGNGEQNAINFAKSGPTVILFVGVNGVGKTTTIGKMAKLYHDQGKKVLLAAADTFRAGAIQQLAVWAERDGVDIVAKEAGSDPASVVYDAVAKAKRDQYDVLFVDTAGRLQNKVNLMNELAKMKKILTREIPDSPHEVMLVLDSTTGQNALNQAKLFKQVTDVTGITLTKLDGTAKGGIVLAIRSELHLSVKFVGLGEKVSDLEPFNAEDFVYGLFKGLLK